MNDKAVGQSMIVALTKSLKQFILNLSLVFDFILLKLVGCFKKHVIFYIIFSDS